MSTKRAVTAAGLAVALILPLFLGLLWVFGPSVGLVFGFFAGTAAGAWIERHA